MSGPQTTNGTPEPVIPTSELLWTARLFSHLKKPENLLVYLCVSAWAKFMGVSEFIPTITVG